MEICTNKACKIDVCKLRHSRSCRYHRDIGFCKFGEWCLFKHDICGSGYNDVKEISNKVKDIENLIAEKTELINSLEKMLKESQETSKNEEREELGKQVDQKIEVFEKTINTFHKC